MAATPQYESFPPGEKGQASAVILPFPAGRGRGALSKNGPLPYDIEISDWSDPKEKFEKGVGLVQTSVVELADESRFVFRKTLPDNLSWETSVDFTVPLATRVTGFNTYLARKLAQANMQSRIVGTNQEQGFSLLHDAQATLHILDRDDRQAETSAPDESLFTGYSMGTMKALAILGLSPAFGRDIKTTIGLDPCLAAKVDYNKQLEEFPELIKYLGREVLEVYMALGDSFLRESPLKSLARAKHLISTVGITKEYLRNTHDKWNVLASGETGNFPPSVPAETTMILHFFNKCRFNDAAKFKQLFAGHQNVRIREEDGYHLSGARSDVVGRVVSKVQRAQQLLAEGVAPGELVEALDTPILRPRVSS